MCWFESEIFPLVNVLKNILNSIIRIDIKYTEKLRRPQSMNFDRYRARARLANNTHSHWISFRICITFHFHYYFLNLLAVSCLKSDTCESKCCVWNYERVSISWVFICSSPFFFSHLIYVWSSEKSCKWRNQQWVSNAQIPSPRWRCFQEHKNSLLFCSKNDLNISTHFWKE